MEVYDIINSIGSGSFGQVYIARHKREGKNYVIKRVKIRDMKQKDLENTEQEVRLLQKLRHTNIVAYKDSFLDREQHLNICMVHCEGGDIYTKIKEAKGKNFQQNQVLDWFVQMALALHYLHERRILHRDLKTQNIFLKNGRIRLGDFGIAKVLDSTRDFANTCIGTPYYMSPELFKNKPYGYKSDIWALGCVLYELCNLRHAFDAQSLNGLAMKILRGNYPSLNSLYSKPLRDLVTKMLSVKPAQRPTIVDVLAKPFLRRRAVIYFRDCLSGPAPDLATTDVDDLHVDSLREQAEKLGLLSQLDPAAAGPEPAVGALVPPSSTSSQNSGSGFSSSASTKSQSKSSSSQIGSSRKSKNKIVVAPSQGAMPGQMQQRADDRRVKKAERELKQLQREIKGLQEEKRRKMKLIREKYTFRGGPRDKGKPSPSQSKREGNEEVKDHSKSVIQQSKKAPNSKLVNPAAMKRSSVDGVPLSSQDDIKAVKQLSDWEVNRGPSKSSDQEKSHLPTNNAEIKSIFSVGRSNKTLIKSTRKSASDAGAQAQVISQAVSKYNQEEEKKSPGRNSFDFYQKDSETPSGVTSRQKVLAEKQLRKREEQERREAELQKIRLENMKAGHEAKQKEMAQYRPSTAMRTVLGDSKQEKSRKIEEERDMFEEDRDLELEQEKEGELENIPEELDEQDDQEEAAKRLKGEGGVRDQETETQIKELKQSVRFITERIETLKQALFTKTRAVQELKVTIGPGKTQLNVPEEIVGQDSAEESTSEVVEDSEKEGQDESDEDDVDEGGFQQMQKTQTQDPEKAAERAELNRLNERIKLLRHRGEAGIGSSLFDKAYQLLRGHQKLGQKAPSGDSVRKQLCELLGEENIGFWAIISQVLFLQNIRLEVFQIPVEKLYL